MEMYILGSTVFRLHTDSFNRRFDLETDTPTDFLRRTRKTLVQQKSTTAQIWSKPILFLIIQFLSLAQPSSALVVNNLPALNVIYSRSDPESHPSTTGRTIHQSLFSTSFVPYSQLWLTSSDTSHSVATKRDRVVRILDDGSIKLKESGVISLAGVRIPKNQSFPPCLRVSPVMKLGQVLPIQTEVFVESSTSKGVILTRARDGVVVNERIVELGYARASAAADVDLKELEHIARVNERGLFQACEETFQASFESLDPVAAQKPVPRNPGDRVGCSDFSVYEDALKYYETYFDLYGDVARLDRNGDGIPCPGLPHTSNPELYRLKKPR